MTYTSRHGVHHWTSAALHSTLTCQVHTSFAPQANHHRSLFGGVLPPGPGPQTTLLVSDVEGSTQLWESLPAAVMEKAMLVHHATLRRSLAAHVGYESGTQGDAFFLAFHSPAQALAYAVSVQAQLLMADWPDELLEHQLCKPCWYARNSGAQDEVVGLYLPEVYGRRPLSCWASSARISKHLQGSSEEKDTKQQQKFNSRRSLYRSGKDGGMDSGRKIVPEGGSALLARISSFSNAIVNPSQNSISGTSGGTSSSSHRIRRRLSLWGGVSGSMAMHGSMASLPCDAAMLSIYNSFPVAAGGDAGPVNYTHHGRLTHNDSCQEVLSGTSVRVSPCGASDASATHLGRSKSTSAVAADGSAAAGVTACIATSMSAGVSGAVAEAGACSGSNKDLVLSFVSASLGTVLRHMLQPASALSACKVRDVQMGPRTRSLSVL